MGEPREVKYKIDDDCLDYQRSGEEQLHCFCPYLEEARCGIFCPLFEYNTTSTIENKVILHCCKRQIIPEV